MRSEQPKARVEGLSDEDRARLHVLDQHGERRLRERIEALIRSTRTERTTDG